MPMHITPSIDTDFDRIEPMLSQTGSIATPLSSATQSDIMGILQREQDRAMALLSSSPLLASLFVSYANQAAALESLSATPTFESEERKTLQSTITALREEIEELKSENIEAVEGLKAAKASQEAFRSQVSSLKEVNTTQQADIKSLRAGLTEAKDKQNRLIVDSNAEKAALRIQVLDLEVERGELKEAVVDQQIKISKLERQGEKNGPPRFPPAITPQADESDPVAGKENIPGGSENVEPRTPLVKKGNKRLGGLSDLSKATTPNDSPDHSKLDVSKHLNAGGIATGVSTSSESEGFTDTEHKPPPAGSIKEEVPITPNLRPSPSLATPQAQVSTPTPAQQEPLSLWERKRLKAAALSVPASSSLSGGETLNPSVISGETGGGGGGCTESIAMPATVGDSSSILMDAAGDKEREEPIAKGLLGLDSTRRGGSLDQSQRRKTNPAPPPTLPQKPSGWGSWGSSLLNNIANAAAVERSPPAELPVWGTKAMGTPSGFGGSVLGSATGPTFGAGIGKNPTVNDVTTPQESNPNATGTKDVPKSALEIKQVPIPGGSNSSSVDKITGGTCDDTPRREGIRAESEEKMEETATPVQEDDFDFDWLPPARKKKEKQVSAAGSADVPSVPNTGGGGGGGKKKKLKRKK